jgi:hypothetical protein
MLRGEHTWEVWGYVGNSKYESIWCPRCRGTNTESLKWQRSIWERDQELVKRSGRDKSIWVVTRLCMEGMLGICRAILISTSKNALSLLLLLMSSVQPNWREWKNRLCLEMRVVGKERGLGLGGEMAQTMYAHVNQWIKFFFLNPAFETHLQSSSICILELNLTIRKNKINHKNKRQVEAEKGND